MNAAGADLTSGSEPEVGRHNSETVLRAPGIPHVFTVIAGLDGSPISTAVLQSAIEEATLHDGRVRAVHAWLSPYSWQVEPTFAPSETTLRAAAHRRLDHSLTGVDPRNVTVEPSVVEGDPAQVLLRAAESADVLVVGSRRRNRLRRILRPSVSRHCVRHSPVPVIVVEPED